MSLQSWKIFAARTGAIEKKYTPKIHAAIQKAYSSFLFDLKQYGLDQARANLNTLSLNTDLIPVLTSIYRQAGLLGAQMTYNELRKGLKSANIGRNETWIRDVLNYLKLNILQFAAKISETTREDILKIISKGVDEGWGAERIAREIADSGFPLMRARVVARTEAVRGFNQGAIVGSKSFPYEVLKSWSAAKDERTRKAHSQVNGHVTDENGTFKVPIYKKNVLVGYDNMICPGDVNADPSNTINCRCRVVFLPVKDGQGKLVPRRSAPVMTGSVSTGKTVLV
jgi:hypothetical protein